MEKLEARWPLLKGLTISLFFLYFFIKGRLLGESKFYNMLDLAFGVYYYLLILYPLVLATAPSLKSKKKISVLKIRLFSGILFFFFATFYKVIKEMEMSVLVDTNLEQELVVRAWSEMNLGGISTSIMHYLYFNFDIVYLYRVIIAGIGITSFILFTKMITESIRGILKISSNRRERVALRRKEEELQNKISIKEKIDENMNIKMEKSLKQQEEKIQQEVDKFMMGHSRVEETTRTSTKKLRDPLKQEINGKTEEGEGVEEETSGEIISLEELLKYARGQKEASDLKKTTKETSDSSEEAVKEKVGIDEKIQIKFDVERGEVGELRELDPQNIEKDLVKEKLKVDQEIDKENKFSKKS